MIDKEMCIAATATATSCSRNTKFKLTKVPSTLIDRDICIAAVKYDGGHLHNVPLNIIDREICFEAVK